MKISPITRRDIIDVFLVEKINWSGRLEEPQFLARLFDMEKMPSTDPRFENAAQDVHQHRISNFDWEDDWVFHDSRFNLFNCDDEILLKFLCETIHPEVRPIIAESERICELYNECLKNDGFQLSVIEAMSGRPVFTGRYIGLGGTPGISAAKETLTGADLGYVNGQVNRMEKALQDNDPDLAIGTAKELIETCCKSILKERGIIISKNADMIDLIKLTSKELKLTPDDIPEEAKASGTTKRLLSNLAMITQGIAELRNQYGTGHGKEAKSKGLEIRHAKLAVGAASTLAVFLTETHLVRNEKSKTK